MKLEYDKIIEINSRYVFYRGGDREPITQNNARELCGYLESEIKISMKFYSFLTDNYIIERLKMMRMRVPTLDEIESAKLLQQLRMEQVRDKWIEQRTRVEMLSDMLNQINRKIDMMQHGMRVIRNEWKL